MVDHVAASAVQLSGHPNSLEPVRQLGHRGPRIRQPPSRPRRGAARARPRDAGDHRRGRDPRRDPVDALALDLAAGVRADARRRVRDAAAAALLDRARVPGRRRSDPDRLALQRGERVRTPQVTRSAAAWSASATGRVARERAAQPNGWWGMALFLCAEVTLFGTLLATYFYLD